MNHQTITNAEPIPHIDHKIAPEIYEGIYHSRSINKDPAIVYAFCQKEENLKKILQDLPEKISNFLNLEFVNATSYAKDSFQVTWKNSDAEKIQGKLIFTITPDAHKGAVIIANAIFADYTMDNDEPSDLINIFLKRVKALAETGQIATTKGQPNGKDEKEINKNLKH